MNLSLNLVTAGVLASMSAASFAQTDATQTDDDTIKEVVVVTGQRSQVELLDAYAGGQVARGGRAGLLGNIDFLDSPFSGTAYTAELVSAQQSESIGDVLQNDPVVRVAKGFGNFQEVYVLRGFPVYSDDITLNGVYGILPRQFVAAEIVERVEVFRGANAFINGAAPGGSGVGGTINLVPKRAATEGNRRVALGYESGSQLYGAVDFGSRFGDADAWGVRMNAVLRDGETAITDQDRSLNVFSLGTDYAGERARFTADIGYQDNRIDAPRPQVTPLGAIPNTPDADINYAQPWTYTEETQTFAVARGEFDIGSASKFWLAGGIRQGDERNVLANPNVTESGVLSAYRFDNTREDDVVSFDAGFETYFNTGDVSHTLVVSASRVDLESKNAYAFSDFFATFASDLYAPVTAIPPLPNFFIGGDLDQPLVTEKAENQSIAIADTMAFLDGRLLATVGVRQQDIKTNTFDYNSGAPLSSYDADKVTPALGLVWKLSEQMSTYVNYAESLQPGQIAPTTSGDTPVLNAGEVLDPFVGEQVEVGLKYDAGEFGATFALFSLERPNAIISNQVFAASGQQDNQGVEVSVFGEPTTGLRVIGGLTYLDAELAKTQGGLNQGNTPIGVPDLQANVNVEWDVAGIENLTVDARVVHTSAQYIDEANTTELDSWQRVDLGLRYGMSVADKPITVRARIDNLFDESYWASTGGFPGANYLILGNPRTVSVTASFDF